MTDPLTAPALAQALEKMAKRLELKANGYKQPAPLRKDAETLRAAAARLRSAETRPQWQVLAQLAKTWRERFFDYDAADCADELEHALAAAAQLRSAETRPSPVDKFPDFNPDATDTEKAKWLEDFAKFAGLVPAAPALPGETPAEPPQVPADAKEWTCSKCGGDALYCKCPKAPPAVAPVARTQHHMRCVPDSHVQGCDCYERAQRTREALAPPPSRDREEPR